MRRLLNKKGSVLFLVVVVMSILIIAASATFYIVNNQHSSVNVRYSSEQSYQTAVSVSNTVSNYIDGYLQAIKNSKNGIDDYKDTIIGKMFNMQNGTSTDITSAIDLEDRGMGDVKVNITYQGSRSEGENKVLVYYISTEATVNGETSKVTQVKELVSGPTTYFTRFLTSTGSRPEDVVVNAFKILTETYFENDYTALTGWLNSSVYCTGTYHDMGAQYGASSPDDEIIVGENFIIKDATGQVVAVPNIYVGNNMSIGKMVTATNVYVLGDVDMIMDQGSSTSKYFVKGDCYSKGMTKDATIYVNGDLYVYPQYNMGTFIVKGDVHILGDYNAKSIRYGGILDNPSGKNTPNTTSVDADNIEIEINGALSANLSSKGMSNWNDVSQYIAKGTSKNQYQEWKADEYFLNDLEAPGHTLTGSGNHGAIVPGKDCTTGTQYGRKTCTINKSARLNPWFYGVLGHDEWGNEIASWGSGQNYLVFDATDEDLYIYLDADGADLDSDGMYDFTFGDTYGDNMSHHVNIIIEGKHSVIFILPSDTNFIMGSQCFIGSLDLVLEMSARITGQPTYTTLADLIADSGGCANVMGTYFNNASYTSIIDDLLTTEDGAVILDKSQFGASSQNVHNNIFLVTRGTENKLDFNNQSTFCGYIYAPNAILSASGAYDGLSFLGGLIVGSYSYRNTSGALAFTTPYDYTYNDTDIYGLKSSGKKPTSIVEKLMNDAGADSGSASSLQDWRTLGYK
ncbi:MAG: hypothetical protein HDT46_03290 [Ruminococcaceae bacterium]|nr:hypothetical protein [Oscillospiraceae bacterium]